LIVYIIEIPLLLFLALFFDYHAIVVVAIPYSFCLGRLSFEHHQLLFSCLQLIFQLVLLELQLEL